jgi:hypothetical protein
MIRPMDAMVDRSLMTHYRRLAIEHATGDIIFHDPITLEEWRDTFEFRERSKELNSMREMR